MGWLKVMGYPIEQIAYERWLAEIRDRAGNSPENPLYTLISLFSEKVSQTEQPKSAALQFDCQNTLDALAATDLTCAIADENLFRIYFSYLIDRGLIDAPGSEAKGKKLPQ